MRKLVDYDLGLFATAQYLAANPVIEDRADLPQHRFVGYIEDLLQSPELDYLGEIHPALSTVVESSNLVAQVFATLAGTGLCVLPNFIAARQPDLVRVLPNDVRLVRSFWMVAHADLKDLARVRAVMDFVAQEVEASQWLFAP
jgi:DNA-binding transcriptional LysR family regulator